MNRIRRWLVSLSLIACLNTAQAGVDITFLGNQGFLLSDGRDKIIIDGFLGEAYALFEGLEEKSSSHLVAAREDFAGIDLALASHFHFEHFQPDTACLFIKASPDTLFVSSSQVITVLKERCKPFARTHKNIREAGVLTNVPKTFRKDGVEVEIFNLSHGTGKFASIQHYGHLMKVGGKTIVHLGDASPAAPDFIAAGLQNRQIDILIAPYTYFLRASGKLIMRQYLDAPVKIVSHVPPREVEEIIPEILKDFPDAVVFGERMTVKHFP